MLLALHGQWDIEQTTQHWQSKYSNHLPQWARTHCYFVFEMLFTLDKRKLWKSDWVNNG